MYGLWDRKFQLIPMLLYSEVMELSDRVESVFLRLSFSAAYARLHRQALSANFIGNVRTD